MNSVLETNRQQSLSTMWRAFPAGGASKCAPVTNTCTYAGTGYANPHAVTSIGDGLSTTTYSYDNNGNLASAGKGTATTTYGYDAFGQRVLQTGTSTTYIYANKWYSIASSTITGAKFATTTSYVFNGDTLLATVDQ